MKEFFMKNKINILKGILLFIYPIIPFIYGLSITLTGGGGIFDLSVIAWLLYLIMPWYAYKDLLLTDVREPLEITEYEAISLVDDCITPNFELYLDEDGSTKGFYTYSMYLNGVDDSMLLVHITKYNEVTKIVNIPIKKELYLKVSCDYSGENLSDEKLYNLFCDSYIDHLYHKNDIFEYNEDLDIIATDLYNRLQGIDDILVKNYGLVHYNKEVYFSCYTLNSAIFVPIYLNMDDSYEDIRCKLNDWKLRYDSEMQRQKVIMGYYDRVQ